MAMSNTSLAKMAKNAEIPCMLLPMTGHTLLMPTTSVAEMSSVGPLEAIENAPPWLLGLYLWRGVKVPVVSEEGLNGEPVPRVNKHGRIAVLNNTGVDQRVPFIAIHTQSIPRMARVADDDITENEMSERRPFDIMAVKVGMEEFFLPDITAIEMAYAKILDGV